MSEPLPADHREPQRRDGPSPGTTGSPEEAPVLAGVILAAVIAALLMAAAAFLVARSARPAPGSLALAAIAAVGALAAAAGGAAWATRQRNHAQLAALRAVHAQSQAEAAQAQSDLARARTRPPDYRLEVFVNLARRMQSLLYREIQAIDEIESRVEDPGLLQELFTIDHLATRMRRYTESLAVLGGATSRRRWSNPVPVDHVLRAAIAETDHYTRVSIVPPVPGTLRPDAVADVIHLVAELVENATEFSPPGTQALLRVEQVVAGLAIEIDDRGLGMDPAVQRRVNDVLAGRARAELGELLSDGRIGVYVVAALARRYDIAVELHRNIFGGTQAVVVLPPGVIRTDSQQPLEAAAPAPVFVPALAQAQEHAPEQAPPAPAARTGMSGAATPMAGATSGTTPGGAPPQGERPRLPRRTGKPGSYLAPPLLHRPVTSPPAPSPVRDGTEGPDPGLMASFRYGFSQVEEEGMTGPPGRSDPPATSSDEESRLR